MTFTDWDFDNVDWTLDPDIYKTATPSLHGSDNCNSLVKDATVGALSNGRLVTWARSSDTGLIAVCGFRNQAADGTAPRGNCYQIIVGENTLSLSYFLATNYNLIEAKNHTWSWGINTWYKIRITWWTSLNRLYLRVERWTGTEWVTLGGDADTDFEDVNDRWKDETVNRCGVFLSASLWIDDLEVWG